MSQTASNQEICLLTIPYRRLLYLRAAGLGSGPANWIWDSFLGPSAPFYCSGPVDMKAWRFWRVASNLICGGLVGVEGGCGGGGSASHIDRAAGLSTCGKLKELGRYNGSNDTKLNLD